jgi:hypothetical protein
MKVSFMGIDRHFRFSRHKVMSTKEQRRRDPGHELSGYYIDFVLNVVQFVVRYESSKCIKVNYLILLITT